VTIEELKEEVLQAGSRTMVRITDRASAEGAQERPVQELPEEHLYLVMDEGGGMTLGGHPVAFDHLKVEMRRQRTQLSDTEAIVIQINEGISRDRIIEVMDLAKEIGIRDLFIVREPLLGRGEGGP
jgi:biopolymer transport protein ExbD